MRVGKSGRVRVLLIVSIAGLLIFVFGGILVAFAAASWQTLRDWAGP